MCVCVEKVNNDGSGLGKRAENKFSYLQAMVSFYSEELLYGFRLQKTSVTVFHHWYEPPNRQITYVYLVLYWWILVFYMYPNAWDISHYPAEVEYV